MRPSVRCQRDLLPSHRGQGILQEMMRLTALRDYVYRRGLLWCIFDPEEFNPGVTEWSVQYNLNRPHQSLGYLGPVEHIEKELAKTCCLVLPCGQPGRGIDKIGKKSDKVSICKKS
jgi:hypothetical protein